MNIAPASKWVARGTHGLARGQVYTVTATTGVCVGLDFGKVFIFLNDLDRAAIAMPTKPEIGMHVVHRKGREEVPTDTKGIVSSIDDPMFDVDWANDVRETCIHLAFGDRVRADPMWVLAEAERKERAEMSDGKTGWCLRSGGFYLVANACSWSGNPAEARVFDSRDSARRLGYSDEEIVPAPPEAIAAARKRETMPPVAADSSKSNDGRRGPTIDNSKGMTTWLEKSFKLTTEGWAQDSKRADAEREQANDAGPRDAEIERLKKELEKERHFQNERVAKLGHLACELGILYVGDKIVDGLIAALPGLVERAQSAGDAAASDLRADIDRLVAMNRETTEELLWYRRELRRLDPRLVEAHERGKAMGG